MTRLLPILLLLAVLATWTGAVQTSTWSSTEAADFEKGTLDKLSLRSDGRLSLAPVLTQILDSSLPYFWAWRRIPRGTCTPAAAGPALQPPQFT